MSTIVSDRDLLDILLAVGAESTITVADFDRSFEDLELDSLARAEFAAKLQGRSGVDTEHLLTPDITPNLIRRAVMDGARATNGR